jgi:hypothetical protein
VRHDEAWQRLPDLLEDRDDPGLLAHVRSCADCQRQLFLLGRVDRVLRSRAAAQRSGRRRRRGLRRIFASAVGVVAAAGALLGALLTSQGGQTHEMTFRTASGRAVADAVMGHSDTRNVSLALTARRLPVARGHMFVLWADDQARARMEVGQFMTDRTGGCRVRFNLPADQTWRRFWITHPGTPAVVVAETRA